MIGALHQVLERRLAGLDLSPRELLARDAPGGLVEPGRSSANRQCHLLRASDGWLALNLARLEDRELLPVLAARTDATLEDVASVAMHEPAALFRDRAIELQMPVAVLGETASARLPDRVTGVAPRRVVDMSALWAGPLCAGLLAAVGSDVLRIESVGRPDPTPHSSPELDCRLNGAKRRLALDLSTAGGRDRLIEEIERADVLVTSARPMALARLGLEPAALFARCPRLVWAAITAHGFSGEGATRVGFGDDCAVAGGLVRWKGEEPRFLGDALADPLTGLEAAIVVMEQVARGSGGLLDIAMARVAAGYAKELALCR